MSKTVIILKTFHQFPEGTTQTFDDPIALHLVVKGWAEYSDTPKAKAAKKKRKPLSEEHKQKLRDAAKRKKDGN